MRINLFGGPGTGKSTTASWLFSELKLRNISVEYVSEYVKTWAYQKRQIHRYDQVYLFGKQQHDEYKYLTHGVKNIVTDSPVLLAAIYAEVNGNQDIAKNLASLSAIYDKEYPSFNVVLNRGDKEYITEGRYQTKEQAMKMDVLINNYIIKHYSTHNCISCNYLEREYLLKEVLKRVQ